jgi:hypothetical protein
VRQFVGFVRQLLLNRARRPQAPAQVLTEVELEAVTMVALEGQGAFDEACEQSRACQSQGSQAACEFWAAVAVEIAHRTRRGVRFRPRKEGHQLP